MLVVTFAVGAAVLGATQGLSLETWLICLITSAIATGLEALSKLGVDNLTVPLGAAATAYGLSQLWS